jgi:hypothetical protein
MRPSERPPGSSPPLLADRYPRLATYLRRLPRGVDSYPDVQMKLLPLKLALEQKPLSLDPVLPPPILKLIEGPLLPSSWGSSVAAHGVLLAIADAYKMSDGQYVDWTYEGNRDLLDRPVYSVLLGLASPSLLLRGAAARWGTFHRGIEVVIDHAGDKEVRATFRYPSFVLDEVLARGLVQSVRAALERCRARDLVFHVDAITERSTRISARWS